MSAPHAFHQLQQQFDDEAARSRLVRLVRASARDQATELPAALLITLLAGLVLFPTIAAAFQQVPG